MADAMIKLTRDKFIPCLDIACDKTYENNIWKRVCFSTTNTLTMNEQTEDMDYICYPETVTEINSNKPEVELETTLQENEPVYDFLISHFQSLPTGDACKVPMLYLFGGSTKVAWRGLATISGKTLDTTGGKITFTAGLFDIDIGTYEIVDGVPVFYPKEEE